MKVAWRFLVVLGGVAFLPALSESQNAKLPSLNEHTTAIADAATVRLHARTMSGEMPAFRKAVNALDADAGKVMRGTGLVPARSRPRRRCRLGRSLRSRRRRD